MLAPQPLNVRFACAATASHDSGEVNSAGTASLCSVLQLNRSRTKTFVLRTVIMGASQKEREPLDQACG